MALLLTLFAREVKRQPQSLWDSLIDAMAGHLGARNKADYW